MAKPSFRPDLGPIAIGTVDTFNNVSSLLTAGITDSATTIPVSTGTGAKFQRVVSGDRVFATITDGVNIEVVLVTSVSGDNLTVVRDWENTGATGYAFVIGDIIERRLTHGLLQAISPHGAVAGTVEIGQSAAATGTDSVVVGKDASAGSGAVGAVVIGSGATAGAGDSTAVAIGSSASVRAYQAVAIGDTARVWWSQRGVAVGNETLALHYGELVAPPRVCGRATAWGGLSAQAPFALGGVYTQTFPPMDLGVPPNWTTTTDYPDMAVVRDPSAPVGTTQHYLDIQALATDPDTETVYDGSFNGVNVVTAGTQPTWVTSAQGDVTAEPSNAVAGWVMIDPQSGVSMNVGDLGATVFNDKFRFVPTRIGFYCYATTGTITTDPVFNFGNEYSDTAYLSGEVIDGLADATEHQFQWFTIPTTTAIICGVELKITLTTPGVGGSIQGKFLVEGYYVANRG